MRTSEHLVEERYISLGTFRRNGIRVDTPVWAAASDGRLYVFTAAGSGKVKRLRNSARAELAGCNSRGRTHTDWVAASARIIQNAATIERAYAALRAKYGIWMRITDLLSRLSGRIRKRAILEIELAS